MIIKYFSFLIGVIWSYSIIKTQSVFSKKAGLIFKIFITKVSWFTLIAACYFGYKNFSIKSTIIGIIIDISHAGDQTVKDILQISNKPIIASHSSVYNICPHYRNLKDDQMYAIKKNGGVIFINFYPGYIDPTFVEK